MNVEVGTEAAQFPEKEYLNGIFVAARIAVVLKANLDPEAFILSTTAAKLFLACSTLQYVLVIYCLSYSRFHSFGRIWPKTKRYLVILPLAYPRNTWGGGFFSVSSLNWEEDMVFPKAQDIIWFSMRPI